MNKKRGVYLETILYTKDCMKEDQFGDKPGPLKRARYLGTVEEMKDYHPDIYSEIKKGKKHGVVGECPWRIEE